MSDRNEPVEVEVDRVVAETDRAIAITVEDDDDPIWIPKSQILDGSEVEGEGRQGNPPHPAVARGGEGACMKENGSPSSGPALVYATEAYRVLLVTRCPRTPGHEVQHGAMAVYCDLCLMQALARAFDAGFLKGRTG